MFRMMVSKILLWLMVLSTPAYADAILTGSIPYTFTPGTVIASSQMNANFSYIINGVNTNAAINGTNSSITALLGLTTPINQNSGGSPIWNGTTVGGTADAITITATRPAISSFTYTAGNIITFKAIATNTVSAPSVNVNSLGAKSLFKNTFSGPITVRPGEIVNGNAVTAYYDGAQFIVIDLPKPPGALATIASAGTTTLLAAGSHFINVTGTTTITAFGNASLEEPYYFIRFSSPLTITFNATSMITPDGLSMAIKTNDVIEAQYISSGNWRILTHISANPAGILNVQQFSASGTYTPTPGTQKLLGYCIGGGGGGGGVDSDGSSQAGGTGGGGGGLDIFYIPVSSVGASIAVTIGAAGTAGANTGTNGGTGGTTSISGICSSSGGTGGNGVAGTGTHFLDGVAGGAGSVGFAQLSGGASQGSSGDTATFSVSTNGGDSFFAPGGLGKICSAGTAPAGVNGTLGSGGGGGCNFNVAAGTTGGAGGAGFIQIYEYGQ